MKKKIAVFMAAVMTASLTAAVPAPGETVPRQQNRRRKDQRRQRRKKLRLAKRRRSHFGMRMQEISAQSTTVKSSRILRRKTRISISSIWDYPKQTHYQSTKRR